MINYYYVQYLKLKKKSHRIENSYEFISTSNSAYDYGKDRLVFYSINKIKNNIEMKILKKIDNISPSTEADSICKLNNQLICVGLQNHFKDGQINGFAIVNIEKKEYKENNRWFSCIFPFF